VPLLPQRISLVIGSRSFDSGDQWWDSSHVTTLVKADDKGRILIRGTERGRQYLISSQNGGWWVMPAPAIRPPSRRRAWTGPRKDLSAYFQEMANLGFAFEASETSSQKAEPCRF
jgi:hypothetical protein